MLNLGYRHKSSDRLSGTITVQDVLATFENRAVVDTPLLRTTFRREVDTRFMSIGLTWTFGGGKPRDQGFDFGSGGAPSP